jgi:hypothetical protein
MSVQFPPIVPFLALIFSSEFTHADSNPIRIDSTILLEGCVGGAETSQTINFPVKSPHSRSAPSIRLERPLEFPTDFFG